MWGRERIIVPAGCGGSRLPILLCPGWGGRWLRAPAIAKPREIHLVNFSTFSCILNHWHNSSGVRMPSLTSAMEWHFEQRNNITNTSSWDVMPHPAHVELICVRCLHNMASKSCVLYRRSCRGRFCWLGISVGPVGNAFVPLSPL